MSSSPTTAESTPESKQDSQPRTETTSKTSDKNGAKPDSKNQAKEDLKPDAKPKSGDDLKSIPIADLQKKLGSSPDGLSQAEAQKRLTQYGPNAIAEKKTNAFLKLLSYFWGPIPWMIEVAVILSGVVRHWMDFGIILFLLLSNAVVGFWEEHQAGNAIAALKARLAIDARATATVSGRLQRQRSWFPATSSACDSATSFRRTRAYWRAIRSKWISRR